MSPARAQPAPRHGSGALTELESDPLALNTTARVSQPDRRRLRVGSYRVISGIDERPAMRGRAHERPAPSSA